MIRSMGSIDHVASKVNEELFSGRVEITEKIDGSFFSFGMVDGVLSMRSKGQELHFDAPSSGMFKIGMDYVQSIAHLLVPDWIYRGEFLMKPKHNSLAYNRAPQGHVALFDIEEGLGYHKDAATRASEAARLGFDYVPVLFDGEWTGGLVGLTDLLDTQSILGGQKIEGVVVKNFDRFVHGRIMMGKLVSEMFKEVHSKEWKTTNPDKGDVVMQLIANLKSDARWNKAIQHLRDGGLLTNSPRDIGPLLKEIGTDVLKEEEEMIKASLFKWAWPQIQRGITAGFPDWYKQRLLEDG